MQEPYAPQTCSSWQVLGIQGFNKICFPVLVVHHVGTTQSYVQLLVLGLSVAAAFPADKGVATVPLMGWKPICLAAREASLHS